MGMYRETSSVWRDFAEMEASMPLAMGFQLVFSAWTTFAFTQIYKEGGITQGLLFGLYFGVFAGILTASWYLWLPVPEKLGWSWLASGIMEGLGGSPPKTILMSILSIMSIKSIFISVGQKQ